MSNKSKSSKSSLGRPPVIDLTSTNLISPVDTGYLKGDLTRLAKMEKKGKLSHVASFEALYQVLQLTGDSWLHDLQETDWDKCIFTGHPGTLRPKAAELTSLQPPGNHEYFVGGAAVVEALLRTAQFFHFPDALIRRLKLCHPNYRPPPALLHAAQTEGEPTVSSLTATSSSIDICCDTANSERVELETFLQQSPVTSSSSSSATAASTANVPSCTQLSTFSSSSSSSSSWSSNEVNGAQSNASNDAEKRNLIEHLLEVFSQPTPLPHPSNAEDIWFHQEFSHLHKIFKKGAWNVASFKELYSMLRKANDRWRIVTEQNQDAGRQRASRKKGYVIEDFDATAVRVYFGLAGAKASEYAKDQKDVDYFVGDDRLLQYVGMQTLQYGNLALASEIADIRERFRSGSFPLVRNNDAPVRTTEDSHTPPTTRHREEEALVNEETTAQQQDATVLTKSRPLSPTSSERSRKRRRQSAPLQDAATSANHTAHTQNGHGTTLLPLQPPPLAPAKSATINATRTSLPQHVVVSDEDSDEIATQRTNPRRSRHGPHMTADSKPVPTRQRLMCSKLRGNSHLTFYDTKKG